MKGSRFIYPSVLALLLSGCGSDDPAPEPVVRPVVTITVPEKSAKIERAYSGVVDSVDGTGIAFEVGGRVVEVNAKDGVRYEKGAILAQLDTREFKNQLNSADARRTEARQTLRRTQQLFETGNASQSQLESAIAQEKSAVSSYNTALKQLEDATLKMPYPGVIGSVNIEIQTVVSPGQAVMTIQGEGKMEFDTSVPAEFINLIRVGMDARVKLGIVPDKSFAATVDTVSPDIAENTTYPITLKFEEEDSRIRTGLDGEAIMLLPNPLGATIAIPAVCVATLPHAEKFVWVVKTPEEGEGSTTVHRRTVTTGDFRAENRIEVLSGLESGEVVVSRGVHRLEEGQEVRLMDAE